MSTKSTTKNKKELFCKGVFVCGAVVIDEGSNLLSLINIIDEITVTFSKEEDRNNFDKGSKSVLIPIDVVVLWKREEGVTAPIDLNFTMQFIGPDGKVLMDGAKGIVRMETHHRIFRTRFKYQGITCDGAGIHKFRIISEDPGKTGGEIVFEEPIRVQLGEATTVSGDTNK